MLISLSRLANYNFLAYPLGKLKNSIKFLAPWPTGHPEFQVGIMLRPEFAALLMSISSIIVATNAVLLKRVEKHLIT